MNETSEKHPLFVIIGHYGSGKTEFAVNLAVRCAEAGQRTRIADLDIVNPYFRSREKEDLFKDLGITLIGSPPGCDDADVPAISAEINTIFENEDTTAVIDAGGDPAGAGVLRRFAPRIRKRGAKVLFIFNAARPGTRTAEAAVRYLKSIEAASGLKAHGIVNNTHLMGETSVPDILSGAEEAGRLSRLTGLPLVCHMISENLAEEAGKYLFPVFPAYLYMKKPWE